MSTKTKKNVTGKKTTPATAQAKNATPTTTTTARSHKAKTTTGGNSNLPAMQQITNSTTGGNSNLPAMQQITNWITEKVRQARNDEQREDFLRGALAIALFRRRPELWNETHGNAPAPAPAPEPTPAPKSMAAGAGGRH